MKVLFALSIHRVDDERVNAQQMETLNRAGFQTAAVSLIDEGKMDGTFSFREKISYLKSRFADMPSDVIVGDSPIVILAAWLYKLQFNKNLRIVYDVTEWVPSKKNLTNCPLLLQPIKVLVLMLFSGLAGCFTSAFLFGEYFKAKPFRFFFKWKPYLFLSYYATYKDIKRYPNRKKGEPWRLCYSGGITSEKGFDKVSSVIRKVALKRPQETFVFKFFSSKNPLKEGVFPPNVVLDYCGYLSFNEFCARIGEADIYFDLRRNDFENNRCLPIKLFYYMASGRVVIYSDLKAIRVGVPEIDTIGVLVNPNQEDEIVEAVLKYIDNEDLFEKQCLNAKSLSESKYNWESIEQSFIDFIKRVGNG